MPEESSAARRRILFLCVANSARSQLAEGAARKMFGQRADVRSAGSVPSGFVQPWALKLLREDGMDASSFYSKAIEDLPGDFVTQLDDVITLCAEEVCPAVITKARRLHWPLPDPAAAPEEEKETAFREALESIRVHLKGLF